MWYALCLLLLAFLPGDCLWANKGSIGIYTYPVAGCPPWDLDSVKQGIAGSEEAVIYLSQELAALGYQVTVLGSPPVNSPYSSPSSNPRFVPFCCPVKCDIAVAWRMPNAAQRLKQHAKRVYLWPHDTCHAHFSEAEISSFDDVLWISEWQRSQWGSTDPHWLQYQHICYNGIDLTTFPPLTDRKNPYACIYGSNYARGLHLLLDVWPEVKKQYPKATLDIYYGWQHWGLLSKEEEAQMKQKITALATSDVREHGCVSHKELNEAYAQSGFWTYPCIAWETFCISGVRAQYAGAVPVVIQGTALQETVPHGFSCKTREEYLATLLKALSQAEKISLEQRQTMRSDMGRRFTWKQVAERWSEIFENDQKND